MSEGRADYGAPGEFAVPRHCDPPYPVEGTGYEWRCCNCKTRLGAMMIFRVRGKLLRMPHIDGMLGPVDYVSLPCPRCGASNKRGAHEVRGV